MPQLPPKPDQARAADDAWLARRIVPERSALLLIDFQNDFCADGGWYDRIGYDVSMGQQAAARAAEILPRVRESGTQVVFVKCDYDEPYRPAVMVESYEYKGLPLDYCIGGTWGGDFYGVTPQEGDLVMVKHRYSAFVHTQLEAYLRAKGIENLLFAGVATNVCVDSSARDAYMRDYRVTVLEDCCGTYDKRLHDASLDTLRRAFGVVATSRDVERVWEQTGALSSPATA